MPCGPLQTMQLYALGTGSAFAGALSMFIFSAGTVPLMLVFGFAAALLPRKVVPIMVRASAVLVMFLGVVTFARAASLAGIALPELTSLSRRAAVAPNAAATALANAPAVSDAAPGAGGPLVATLADGIQTVTTAFTSGQYVPFVVQAGVPLKWTIRVTADDLNGCDNPVTVPAYGIQKTLVPGDNLIEFTPKATGVIGYTCWMGMIRSRITVVSDLGKAATLTPDQLNGPSGQGGPRPGRRTRSIGRRRLLLRREQSGVRRRQSPRRHDRGPGYREWSAGGHGQRHGYRLLAGRPRPPERHEGDHQVQGPGPDILHEPGHLPRIQRRLSTSPRGSWRRRPFR